MSSSESADVKRDDDITNIEAKGCSVTMDARTGKDYYSTLGIKGSSDAIFAITFNSRLMSP